MSGTAKLTVIVASILASTVRPEVVANDQIAGLLELGWDRSPKAGAAAVEFFSQIQDAGAHDPRLLYAHSLVLIRHRKYDEAANLLDEIVSREPENLPAHRARIWIAMLTKNYNQALAQMESLSRQFPEHDLAGDQEEPYRQSAAFLGRLIGYLEGPAASSVAEHIREDHRQTIIDRLSTGRRQVFDDAVQQVLDRFAEIDLLRDQRRDDARLEQEEIRQRELKRLSDQKEDLEKQQASLDKAANRLEQEFSQRVGQVNRQLQPINTSLSRLQNRAAALNRQLASLQAEIVQLYSLAEQAPDAPGSAGLRSSARLLERSSIGLELDLSGVIAESNRVASQRDLLLAERQSILKQQRAAVEQLSDRRSNLRKRANRIAADQRKTARPVSGNTTAVLALGSRAGAFTTYEPFPLEQEKQRLLDELD